MPESLRAALASGRRLVGTMLTLPGAVSAELLAEPFDLVVADLEHGALGVTEAQELLIGAQAAGAHALVRLPADADDRLSPMLDAGADGIVIADVRAAAIAADIGTRLVHAPRGLRGYGPRRSSLRGRTQGAPAAAPVLWIQIESPEGVAAAAEIAALDAVDGLLVGTADLSFGLGVPLQQDAPELLEAVRAVRAACAGKAAFGIAGALTTAPRELLEGAALLLHSTDARLVAAAADDAAAWLRGVGDEQRPDGGSTVS